MEENPRAKAMLLKAVKEQIESPESPYVKTHYDRLVAEGHEEGAAREMLGAVLAVEMWEMNVKKRGFDETGYIALLERLPDMSWLDEE